MNLSDSYRNRVLWITGASSGIGRALAEGALAAGAFVVVTARRSDALAAIAARAPERCTVLPADLEDIDGLEDLAEAAWDAFGRLDGLFYAAGISQRSEALETSPAVEERLLRINYRAPVTLTKALLPKFVNAAPPKARPEVSPEARPGAPPRAAGAVAAPTPKATPKPAPAPLIAVVTSLAAYVPTPLRSTYSAAKGALAGYIESLGAEVLDRGVQVTHVVPGFVRTDISSAALEGDGSTYGAMDANLARGMDPALCARKILAAVARRRTRVFVALGVKGHLALFLSRYVPGVLRRALQKVGSR